MDHIIFCRNPLNSSEVDPDFSIEFEAARRTGLEIILIDFESVVANDRKAFFKKMKSQDGYNRGIYRGWMMTPTDYSHFHEWMLSLNIVLINDPHQYRSGHWLPSSYHHIENKTPKTLWFQNMAVNVDSLSITDYELIMERLSIFGDNPIIIKDYVKSCKQWEDSFLIKSAIDAAEVMRVTENFIRNRYGVEGGLVYREFVQLTNEPETRTFIINGSKFIGNMPNVHEISNFFTVDTAKTIDGKEIIIEFGDGQVSGLKEHNADDFYNLIASIT